MRGLLVPPTVPLAKSRSELFDELVLDAVEHLEGAWGARLRTVEFAVEDVPPELPAYDADVLEDGEIPLARLLPERDAGRGQRVPARIVIYRRPLEARAGDRADLADLVHDVVVEQVANLLGLDPDEVDPGDR
jgi:predicted Zn-dependent protease with MMP-like domain